MLKVHQLIIYILSLHCALSITSCFRCGPDIELAKFDFLDSTEEFKFYDINDILEFVDSDGNEYLVTHTTSYDSADSRIILNTLCDVNLFDRQHEYISGPGKGISLKDENENIHISLTKTIGCQKLNHEIEYIDSIAIFDKIFASASFRKDTIGSISTIITGIHQNEVSNKFKSENNISKFIGDTSLFNVLYSDVFESSDSQGSKLYYSKLDGIILLYKNDNQYLKLKT